METGRQQECSGLKKAFFVSLGAGAHPYLRQVVGSVQAESGTGSEADSTSWAPTALRGAAMAQGQW